MSTYEARIQRIRDALKAQGHSGRWLHRKSGLALETVRRALAGTRRAQPGTLLLLELALGLNQDKEAE